MKKRPRCTLFSCGVRQRCTVKNMVFIAARHALAATPTLPVALRSPPFLLSMNCFGLVFLTILAVLFKLRRHFCSSSYRRFSSLPATLLSASSMPAKVMFKFAPLFPGSTSIVIIDVIREFGGCFCGSQWQYLSVCYPFSIDVSQIHSNGNLYYLVIS